MSIGRGGTIDRRPEVQGLDDPGGRQVEHFPHRLFNRFGGDRGGLEGFDHDGHRIGDTDRVGDLRLTAGRQTRRHDVLGHPPHRVGRRAVDLGGIFPAERAAAVPRHAAVGVHDDLAAGEPGIALRSADDKAARGVDEDVPVRRLEPRLAQHRLHDQAHDPGAQVLAVHEVGVLGRHDDLAHAHRTIAFVDDAHLGLPVRAQPRQVSVLAGHRQALGETVREHDGQRHERRRLFGGVPEHHALIPRPAAVDAEGDVGGLFVDRGEYRAGLGVEAEVGVGIADGRDGAADDVGDVDVGRGSDLPCDDGHAGRHEGFARDARHRVAGEDGVQDRVGDLVGDLVGVSLRDRLGGEDVAGCGHSE